MITLFWWFMLKLGYSLSANARRPFHWVIMVFLSRVMQYRKKVITRNLEITKITDPDKFHQFTIQYYDQLANYFTQILYGYFAPREELESKVNFENPDLFQTSLDQGKNIFILASHLGNWEWSSMLLPLHVHKPVIGVYKPLSNKTLDKIILECRSRFGLILSPMAQVIKLLVKNTDQPSIYIFISDQRPAPDVKGETIAFFNIPTAFNNGAFKLAKRYNADLYYQEINPNEKDEYTVRYKKIDEDAGVKVYANALEYSIKTYPTFWLWSHNRWK